MLNQNLEAMAKQLYDYWFVQFDFPDENGRPYKSNGGAMVWCEKLKREIPTGWNFELVGNVLQTYPKTKKIPTEEYLSAGLYPIFDQDSAKYIAGYTNDVSAVLNDVPATLFGDHSTCVKLINMPFARGADGTQILYSKNEVFTPYFFFLAVNALQIPNPGYSRHFQYLKELPLLKPSLTITQKFESIITPLFEKWHQNIINTTNLTKLRDELLPLLMNEQVSVNSDLSLG